MEKMLLDIGTGIYTTSDIAQILGIDKSRVRRWLKNYFSDHLKTDKFFLTNFLAMIELYIFNMLIEKGAKLSNVKKLYNYAKRQFKSDYPFATYKVYQLGNQAFLEKANFIIDGHLSGVIKEFVEPYWKKIEFSPEGLAERFYPLGKEHHIVVDPQIQFGRPVIEGTRITVDTLYDMLLAGDSKEEVAFYYSLPLDAINDVELFYNQSER